MLVSCVKIDAIEIEDDMTQQSDNSETADSGLNQASDEVKLAVDLIYLLETHGIAPAVALAALEIVERDLQSKLSKG